MSGSVEVTDLEYTTRVRDIGVRMRIGYIVTMRKGLPAFVYREIMGLIELGHQVFLYVMKNGSGPYMPKHDWPVRRWNLRKLLGGALLEFFQHPSLLMRLFIHSLLDRTVVDFLIGQAFARQMRADGLDVLLCFEGLHGLRIGYYCNRLTEITITVIVHAEMLRIQTRREFTRRALLACKKIISPTELNCKRIRDEFSVPHDKVVLNRMSVDTENFRHDDRFKILITGFFAERKGHETLLRAVKHLNRDDIVVWIVGGDVWGGESFDVKKFILEHGLKEKTILFGRVSDPVLHVLLDTCDIFCLPCRTPRSGIVEGLPVAIMEAMAYQKPVISTRHTGIPELVSEILVDENDYIGVAEAILKLKNDRELRQRMGLRNREIIEEKFGPKNLKSFARILGEN